MGDLSNNSPKDVTADSWPYSPDKVRPAGYGDPAAMQTKPKPKEWFGTRHFLAILGFFGFWNIFCLRVNLSVAIVAMVNSSSLALSSGNTSAECPVPETTENGTAAVAEGEFEWDESTQGLLQSSFYWGYVATQVPGGLLAERCGGKTLFGLGVLTTAIAALLTPVAARAGIAYLIALRAIAGLGEGPTYPAIQIMLAKWAPPEERSKIGSFVYAGAQMGTAFGIVISGVLVATGFAGGWPSVFYVTGTIGIVWVIFWMLLAFDCPRKHPRISDEERKYIESSLGQSDHQCPAIPWRSVLSSMPVWAILFCHIGQNWGFFTMLHELPTYMKNILHFDMSQSSLLSPLPYLVMWLSSLMASVTADCLLHRGVLAVGTVRKLFNTVGYLGPAAALVGASFTGCDRAATVALLTAAVGLNGMAYSGFLVNHIDLSTNFAGTLMGITNCAATISGILAPYVCGLFISGQQDLASWQNVFFTAAGIYLATDLIFVIFGAGVQQPWNNPTYCGQDKSIQLSTVSGRVNVGYEPEESPTQQQTTVETPAPVMAL